MPTQSAEIPAETAIREAVDSWLAAARSKDLDRIMALYAPEVVAFDAVMKHQFRGVEAYRQHWQSCLEFCPGEMVMEAHELTVTARPDVGFCHYLARCGHRNEKGEERTGWMRATVCLVLRAGEWLIVHEHYSAPFDPESGEAIWDMNS